MGRITHGGIAVLATAANIYFRIVKGQAACKCFIKSHYSLGPSLNTFTALPPQSQFAITTPPPINPGLAAPSYTYTYTYTTPTTLWSAPTTFPTSGPYPSCGDYAAMCPSLNNQACTDSMGGVYGVLCDARWSGIVITTSGKTKRIDRQSAEREEQESLAAAALLADRVESGLKLGVRDAAAEAELEARTFTGTFDGCATYCDMFDKKACVGVSYNNGFAGNCWSMDQISGSFVAPGQIAAVRQE